MSRLDQLVPADKDIVSLGLAVEQRFLEVMDLSQKITGLPLPIPQSIDRTMFYWRRMLVRFRQGDFRYSDSEKKATREMAQWTLDHNCRLRNQKAQVLEWKD